MSNWICDKCGATYIDVSHQEPSVLKQEIEIRQLKELLKECGRQLEEVELCRYDVADVDQEDWFRISTEQAGIANKMKTQIDEILK